MDFKGQKLAETAGVWIVTVFAVLAFLVGYARQVRRQRAPRAAAGRRLAVQGVPQAQARGPALSWPCLRAWACLA